MLTDNIKWLGHAAFRVDGSKTIYFDPFRIDEGKKADIILVSHKHHDHCSKEDILKILKQWLYWMKNLVLLVNCLII